MDNIVEGNLTLRFDLNHWIVVAYDRNRDYIKHIQSNGLKAVDIIGLKDSRRVFLIEIKDYTDHERENIDLWESQNEPGLVDQVTNKVKDSIIGILSAYRNNSISDVFWDNLMDNIISGCSLIVVLWLEGDLHRINPNYATHLINHQLKQKLKCIASKVIISNHNSPFDDHLAVTYDG